MINMIRNSRLSQEILTGMRVNQSLIKLMNSNNLIKCISNYYLYPQIAIKRK